MAHVFYCWRIRVMGRSWYIPTFVIMTSLLQCILLGLGSMVADAGGSISMYRDIWMVANFVCDLIITIETTRLLFLRGAASSFKDTRGLVAKLIKLTFETGAVTTVAMLLQFLLSRFGHDFQGFIKSNGVTYDSGGGSLAQLSVFYSISRLYANCLLATLNARLVISKDSTRVQQVSTVLFDVPTSTIVRDPPPANCDDVIIVQSRLDMRRFEEAGEDAESVYVGGAEKHNQEGASQV
ncbi:hypothetical protein BU15DRAFT_72348 [Melanogaster broomeanus]|nr:hypothetical protein BU15DRAFT_72348 [Melanogaster broomeanus]